MVLTPLITTTDTKETGEMVKGRYDVWIRLPDPSSLQDSNGWVCRPRVYTSCIGWRSESVCFFIATSLWHYPRHCQERRSIDSKKSGLNFQKFVAKLSFYVALSDNILRWHLFPCESGSGPEVRRPCIGLLSLRLRLSELAALFLESIGCSAGLYVESATVVLLSFLT